MDRNQIKEDLIRSANKELGICEQLRCVYDSVYKMPNGVLKNEITEKLVDAFIMAKKMGNRLSYYYELTGDQTGHAGENLKLVNDVELLKERKKRIWT